MRRAIIRPVNSQDGVSLLEVLVAMIILAFGILGLAPMVVLSVESNIIGRDHSIASNLAKEVVEHYEGLDSLPAVPFAVAEDGLNGEFIRSVSVVDNSTDSTIADGLCRIDVLIQWRDHENQHHAETYSTYIFK